MSTSGGQFLPNNSENPEHLRAALPAIPPGHDVASEPYRCYRINTDFVGFLLAGIDTYVHPDAFVGTRVAQERAAQRFTDLQVLLMTGNLLCGENADMKLRQNPNDPCQLQQSADNGASWSLAFDYALCLSKAIPVNSLAAANASATAVAVAEAHAELWVGNYWDIAPSMDFDLSEADELRDGAYCFAVQLLLLQLSAALSVMENSGWDKWDVIEVIAEVTSVVSDLILGAVKTGVASVHPIVYIGSVIAGVASTVVLGLLNLFDPGADVGHFIDPETQRELLCCAHGVIGGMTPDFLRFSQMFQGCGGAGLSAFTQAFLDGVVAEQATYLAFLGIVEEAFQALDGGQVFNCPCDVETLTFEFTTESGVSENTYYGLSGWLVNPFDAGCLTYVPEGGLFFGDETTGDFNQNRGVSVYRDGISGKIESVEIIGRQVMGVLEGLGTSAHINYGGDGQHWTYAENNAGDPATYKRVAYRELSGAQVSVKMYTDNRFGDSPVFTGTCVIERVIIKGQDLAVV